MRLVFAGTPEPAVRSLRALLDSPRHEVVAVVTRPDARRFRTGLETLETLDTHLAGRDWLVGDAATIADVTVFAYTHVAGDAGFELERYPAVVAWLERVRALPGFVDDLAPYPENTRPGMGRSIYD